MRFVGTEAGRTILLAAGEAWHPVGGTYMPGAIQLLGDRYAFQFRPDVSRLETFQAPLTFRLGRYPWHAGEAAIQELQFHAWGMVATCTMTDIADELLNDLLEWGQATFGWRPAFAGASKLYSSTVIVDFEVDPENIIKDYEHLSSIFFNPIRDLYGIENDLRMLRLGLSCDPTKLLNAGSLTEFLIERRANQPYDARRLYSVAPLPTQRHLDMLEELERFAASRGR
jgi:hypothetical protein